MKDWKEQLQNEFDRAELMRAKGNEGQARVCARRATGIAIREYYARQGIRYSTPSAIDLLNHLAEDPRLSPELRQSITYLTLRVNEEHKLPPGVDLLVEAHRLCNELLAE